MPPDKTLIRTDRSAAVGYLAKLNFEEQGYDERMWIPRAELEEVLGEERARTLLGLCGGRSLYIPKRVRGDGLLAQRVGIETAELLSKAYAGLTVELPSPQVRKTVKHEIIELLGDGELSLSEIAFMLRVTTRYVEIVKRAWVAGELDNYR